MTVFCIGAYYDGDDVLDFFINRARACVGWDKSEGRYPHTMLRRMTIGDLVAIKSYSPAWGLRFKAVGMVTRAHETGMTDPDLGDYVDIEWRWTGWHEIGHVGDRADSMRTVTLYEEHTAAVQKVVVDLFLGHKPAVIGKAAHAVDPTNDGAGTPPTQPETPSPFA